MRIRYEGKTDVSATLPKVMEFVSEPKLFAKALPGYKGRVRMSGEDEFEIDLEISVGPLSGDIVLGGTRIREERAVTYRGKVTGLNSVFDYALRIEVEEMPGGSRIRWVVEGTMSGLVSMVGETVVDRVARKIMEEVQENTRRELARAAGGI